MATQGQNTSQVGSINVGVTADLTGLRSGLKQAEAEAKAAAPKIAAAASIPIAAGPYGSKASAFAGAGAATASGGLAGAGRSLRNLTAPLRTFISGLTSITTIFLRLSGIVGLLIAGFAGVVTVLKGVQSAMSSVDGVTARATQRIEKLKEDTLKELVDAATKAGHAVAFTTEEFSMQGDSFKSLEAFRKKVHETRNQVNRDLSSEGIISRQHLTEYIGRLEKAVFDPRGSGNHDRFADALVNARELLKTWDELVKREEFLRHTDTAILELRRKIRQTVEDEIGARLRLNRVQEQNRFGAERQAADISRMVTLLEVIARQRR